MCVCVCAMYPCETRKQKAANNAHTEYGAYIVHRMTFSSPFVSLLCFPLFPAPVFTPSLYSLALLCFALLCVCGHKYFIYILMILNESGPYFTICVNYAKEEKEGKKAKDRYDIES